MPEIAVPFAPLIELISGALLILGALSSVVGILLAVNVIGTLVIAHLTPTPLVDHGGRERVAPLAAGELLVAAGGLVRCNIDRLLFTGKKGKDRKRTSVARSVAAVDA
ncbi:MULTISPECIES: DoxX family protein [unclassified Brevibacterium]|uniref:DoxX family protein n=1 Tax=unclassified Brevibacterium TaxID=2614124 RepID=UPI001F0F17CE|nr:hypothetical protein [Brevibacterium sp. S22]